MVKKIKDIEENNKFKEINEKLVFDAIQNLGLSLWSSKYNNSEKETLLKLKQLVDGVLLSKYGIKDL